MSVTTMSAPSSASPKDGPPAKGKKLILVVVALLAIAGAAYWFVLKPSGEPAEPKAGEVVALEPVQINLAAGHYLRVGIALQLTESAHEADGSKALDATIDLFSGRQVGELTNPDKRKELKKELTHHLQELYHEEVMDVYFTEFVTQ